MNEDLTNEVLEAMAKCKHNCPTCGANEVCSKYDWKEMMQALATALLEERAKTKYNVWKNAPEWATSAGVFWENQAQFKRGIGPVFTRELPKTRARQIAEKEGHGLAEKYGWNTAAKELVTNVMESALNKYAEELEGKE
jgi:hypothetical protein